MERLLDDAENIQRLLPWIGNKEDIVNFIRKIPIDHSHLRIPLSISYFFNLRDQSEENSEQNIENDAREIVILLPDTPYNLIKSRLRNCGNIPNRKEVLVRQLVSERSDLRWILQDIDLNTLRKRNSEELLSMDDPQDNNETNIKIKIRKIDGSLEVVSSIKQEILPCPKKVNGVPELLMQRSVDGDTSSISNSNQLPDSIVTNSTQSSPSDISVITSYTQLNKQLPSTSNIITKVQKNASEVPEPFNLIEYLKDVTQCSEEKIKFICKSMHMSTNQRPPERVLNLILNRLFDDSVIELDDSDNDINSDVELEYPMDTDSSGDELSTNKQQKMIFPRPILKPATLVAGEKSNSIKTEIETYPSWLSIEQIFQPARLNIPIVNMSADVRPAIPENFFCHFSQRNDINADIEENPFTKALEKHAKQTVASCTPSEQKSTVVNLPDPELGACNLEQPVSPKWYEDGLLETFNEQQTMSRDQKKPSGTFMEQETQIEEEAVKPNSSASQEEVAVASGSDGQGELPGPSRVPEESVELPYNDKLVMRMMEMFPEACPDYIKNICRGKEFQQLDDIVTIILSEESYPKRLPPSDPPKDYDMEEQLEIVKALLPDADPIFLRCTCERIGNDHEQLNEFINDAREFKSYPTKKEYLRKQKLSAQSKQYTTEFDVEKFTELFPEPEKTFRDPTRKYTVDNYTHLYICNFFQNRYDKLSVKYIRSILAENNNKILLSDDTMKTYIDKGLVIKVRRKRVILQDPPTNIAVLQELAYLMHKEEIENYVKETKAKEEREKQIAKENGLLNTCQCCYDDEVIPKDTFCCPRECNFCRGCIQKSCEVNLGDGKTDFNCLNDCGEEFTLQTLQKVLPPKMFSKLAQKKALAEVKAAGIEELETCPFCDFASIPNLNDKIFRCLNPDCMKESCRLCKEENHVPYKCDEVEKDADVKARVFVENQMTEALLRKCWRCDKSFFKEEGCNKMTCTCGANMCYICRKPVTDYTHFNGIGGDKFDLCPLYSDTNDFNQKNVIRAAEEAKAKVDPSKLKIDPSLDIQEHYEKRKQQLPEEPHLRLLHDIRNMQQQAANLGAVPRPRVIHLGHGQALARHRDALARQGEALARQGEALARQAEVMARERRNMRIRQALPAPAHARQGVPAGPATNGRVIIQHHLPPPAHRRGR